MGKGRKQRKKSLGEKWKKRRPYPADRTGSGGRQVPEADPPSGRNRGGSRYREKRPAAPGKKTGGGVDVVKLSLIGLGAVAAIAYVIVAFYFGGHFYSGARIYGIDCGRMTAGQVKEEVAKKLGGIHPDRRGAKRAEGCDYG